LFGVSALNLLTGLPLFFVERTCGSFGTKAGAGCGPTTGGSTTCGSTEGAIEGPATEATSERRQLGRSDITVVFVSITVSLGLEEDPAGFSILTAGLVTGDATREV
jgi:hypothetical protein